MSARALAVLPALLLSACVLSLEPLYLTATTSDLQRFLLVQIDVAGAFRPTLELRKAS